MLTHKVNLPVLLCVLVVCLPSSTVFLLFVYLPVLLCVLVVCLPSSTLLCSCCLFTFQYSYVFLLFVYLPVLLCVLVVCLPSSTLMCSCCLFVLSIWFLFTWVDVPARAFMAVGTKMNYLIISSVH